MRVAARVQRTLFGIALGLLPVGTVWADIPPPPGPGCASTGLTADPLTTVLSIAAGCTLILLLRRKPAIESSKPPPEEA